MDDRERKCREYVETRRGAHDQHAEMLTECFIAGAESEATHWEEMARSFWFKSTEMQPFISSLAQAFAQVAAEARDAERAELEALRKVADAARTLWIGQPSDDRIRMQRALWFAVADLDALKSPSKEPK